MALNVKHKDVLFGVGDKIKVHQKLKEGAKSRTQIFEGMVIGIRGSAENKSFTVRRIGAGQIGIERIFPLNASTLEKVELVKRGFQGVKHAKLFYTRDKSKREIDKIYSRANLRAKL